MRLLSTGQFKKDCKRQKKRGKNIDKLRPVIQALVNQEPIEEKYKDHSLLGTWANRRECHIEGDWVAHILREGGRPNPGANRVPFRFI